VFACGIMLGMALKAAEILEKEGVKITVVDMYNVKPLDEQLVVEQSKKCGCVVVAENHNKIGGLTSAISDCLAQNFPTPAEHVAIEDEFGEVGPQDYLEERFDLTPEHIVRKVKTAMSRK
ncbi:MAG: transketolase family protein, partial [Enterococcus sp.]|nr:transketolase family protein [Enterococcus sp.]